MREGDVETADGFIGRIVTVQTDQGPVGTFEHEPVWLNQSMPATSNAGSYH